MAVHMHSFRAQEKSTRTQFPNIWEHRPNERKELSHWSKQELPSLQLIGALDTDHWTKLKRKHQHYVKSTNKMTANFSPRNGLPAPNGGLQLHYYDQSRRRDHMNEKAKSMYFMLPEGHGETSRVKKPVSKKPSIYNQHAKNGFKFWMDRDPMLNKISFCSKYTFGSKHTMHGLGNAPRN